MPRLCRALAFRAAARPALLRNPTLARRLEGRVVRTLLAGLGTPRETEAPRRGRTLARRAEAWRRQNLTEPFGWFSQDYRRLFAETPSQTLQRGRVEAGRRAGKEGRCNRNLLVCYF